MFTLKTVPQTHKYLLEVANCLQKYCGKTASEAIDAINAYWGGKGDFLETDYRLHEDPYYWAMNICHDRIIGDNRPDWDRDPTLWPPPKDFLDYWYRESHGDS